jgi:hypothetical protein
MIGSGAFKADAAHHGVDQITCKLESFDLHAWEAPMWLLSDFESLIFIELIVSTVALALVVAVAR